MAGASAGRLTAEQARFYLALGAVGYVQPAAELAEVTLSEAWAWALAVERPSWANRRGEAAMRLFGLATSAAELVRVLLHSPEAVPGPRLRELVHVAERFYAAALRLDKDVASDGQAAWQLDLDGWAAGADVASGAAATASGAGDRDA
ncbi:MAG: hypothetical protein IT204_21115 [Fimbriimonadaceae bacterium]|nr:hypothetical protein [Fimbriimonadaceae bacterium]